MGKQNVKDTERRIRTPSPVTSGLGCIEIQVSLVELMMAPASSTEWS
jgi:hypothetical protein